MQGPIRWLRGEPGLCRDLLGALAGGDGSVRVLRNRPGRRRLLRVRLRPEGGDAADLLVKHIFGAGRRHPLRDSLKRWLRLGPAEREWRGLDRLWRAGLPVPRPRALASMADGSALLAVDFLEGRSLREKLIGGEAVTSEVFFAIGDVIRALHAGGTVHRDLHPGNILLTAKGPVLVDFQLAWRTRATRSRLRDLGEFDQALARLPDGTRTRRLRVAARALGLTPPYSPEAKRALHKALRASRARARSHVESRTRRMRRPGRQVASFDAGDLRGLRMRDVDERSLRTRLAAAPPERGRSSWKVREWRGRGPLLRALDVFRGSPALRAWLDAHRQCHKGQNTRRPLAMLEERRFGFVRRSVFVSDRSVAAESAVDFWGSGRDGDPAERTR